MLLHSGFCFLVYLDAKAQFANERKAVENSRINIAHALTNDSYTVLEQFAEVLSLVDPLSERQKNSRHPVLAALDENWSQWQLSWDMENVALFDREARRVKSWGNESINAESAVREALAKEMPVYRVVCLSSCYQQTTIPLMRDSKTVGAFSVIRSFADVIIRYNKATNSDIGVLIADSAKAHHKSAYALSGITSPEKNKPLADYLLSRYAVSDLLGQSKTLTIGEKFYRFLIVPIRQAQEAQNGPFFLLVNDITEDFAKLNRELKEVWIYGVLSLSGSLLLLSLLLKFSLRRVELLSEVLPLLSQNQYELFKQRLKAAGYPYKYGHDELHQLHHTALCLADQLQQLEQEVRDNTFTLLEKSQDLARERDFIRQLVDTAPIIIITQKLNGIILSVNQAGVDRLETDGRTIIGKVFDVFIPESDQEHLHRLNRLRSTDGLPQRFEINGLLITPGGRQHTVSWLHSRLASGVEPTDAIILSLGINLNHDIRLSSERLPADGYDHLTGLMNRKKFQDQFTVELASAKRYGYKIALFYLDLDQFKAVNDGATTEVGDELLRQVAGILQAAKRSTDRLYRIGGDEFALIMPHAELQGIHQNAAKIKQRLDTIEAGEGKDVLRANASMGIAIFPDHGLTLSRLLRSADFALYQAKQAGGGDYRIFAPDHDDRSKLQELLNWQEFIENALAKDKFTLVYQPVAAIGSARHDFFECLLRLRRDDGGLIMPAEFISYAEELELTPKIDRWVIKKAVQKLLEFQRQGLTTRISVNLSAHTLNDASLFDDIARVLSAAKFNPGALMFEISESAAIANFSAAETLITQLRQLGCLTLLDDFGVSLSSIYYLKHFPIDFIKLDGSFIHRIDRNDEDKIFVKAVTGLAHAFNKCVIAEFVENEAILCVLKEFGIDYVQGNYIGRPDGLDDAVYAAANCPGQS